MYGPRKNTAPAAPVEAEAEAALQAEEVPLVEAEAIPFRAHCDILTSVIQ